MLNVLTPCIYWAQTENEIHLKVDLIDIKNIEVSIENKKLILSAYGHGVGGLNNYGFRLDFHSIIDPNYSNYKIVNTQIDFTLKKRLSSWWPRLTNDPQNSSWLKIDYDRWKYRKINNLDQIQNVFKDYPKIYDQLYKEEFGYKKEDFKKVYLIFYNLFQTIGYIYILFVIGIKYYRDGVDSLKYTYEIAGNPLKFIQILQFLEIMYPLFGYTKSNIIISFLQVTDRTFMVFCMIEAEPRIQTKPVIFYIILTWTVVEVIRYSYYISNLFNMEISVLTWLRYTIWIPLYPLGFIFEGIIVLRNIPYFEETKKFTINLPSSWNFTFHFPTLLRIYLVILSIPSMFTIISHMQTIRHKKYNIKSN